MEFFTFVVSLLLATSSAAPRVAQYGITVPEQCRGKGFCHIKPEGYDNFRGKFEELLPPYLKDFESRSGEPAPEINEDDDNCPSITERFTVYVYDQNEDSNNIIVQTELFPQKLTIVTCAHSEIESRSLKDGDSQCFRNLGLTGFDIRFTCQESTATRSLLVYEPQSDVMMMKNFTIPVCCSCQIT